jgi:hypothetical protein
MCSWSSVVPEYQGHPGNDATTAAIPFSENRKNHEGLNQLRKDGGGTTPMVFVAKQCCINTAVCQYVMVNQPVQVPLSFWMFSADFLPQTLQNFPLVTKVNCLGNMFFPLRGLLFCFWVITVNPHFILCIFYAISWSLKQNLRPIYHSLNQPL